MMRSDWRWTDTLCDELSGRAQILIVCDEASSRGLQWGLIFNLVVFDFPAQPEGETELGLFSSYVPHSQRDVRNWQQF